MKTYQAGAHSRLTISVEGEDPRLAAAAFSTIVESTNAQPVVVERAMWWPGPDWYEGSLAAAASETGTRWGFAGGFVTMTDQTFALIANTSNRDGTATVRLLSQSTPAVPAQTVSLPANSRINVEIGTLFPGLLDNFGVVIESDGVEIVVEHARYQTAPGGDVWKRGSAALATKLP